MSIFLLRNKKKEFSLSHIWTTFDELNFSIKIANIWHTASNSTCAPALNFWRFHRENRYHRHRTFYDAFVFVANDGAFHRYRSLFSRLFYCRNFKFFTNFRFINSPYGIFVIFAKAHSSRDMKNFCGICPRCPCFFF